MFSGILLTQQLKQTPPPLLLRCEANQEVKCGVGAPHAENKKLTERILRYWGRADFG